MAVKIEDYKLVNRFLISEGVDSILYGSLGVSVYLGNFRDFDDIDLLVEDKNVEGEWSRLKEIMAKQGFDISDEHEHEFKNTEGVKVAFASQNVLVEDNICDPNKDLVTVQVDDVTVRTITPEAFIKAYTFSSTDGYRIDKRGDSDLNIVRKLKSIQESKKAR